MDSLAMSHEQFVQLEQLRDQLMISLRSGDLPELGHVIEALEDHADSMMIEMVERPDNEVLFSWR